MRFRNGLIINRKVKDSSGAQGFVFWISDCFDPPMFLGRGDSFEDAYEWFLCDPFVEQSCEVTDHFEDYIDGWDAQWIQGIGNTNPASLEDLEKAFEEGNVSGALTWSDNGKLLDTEAIQGVELQSWLRWPNWRTVNG